MGRGVTLGGMADPRPTRGRVSARFLWRLSVAILLGAVALELSLRALLFVWPVEGLRRAGLYSARWSTAREALAWEFADPAAHRPIAHHPLLGWTHSRFDGATLAHLGEASIGARRPILLLGDSFAACVTERKDCFEGLVERSELGRRYRLLNYGVPAYGLDQIYLLLRSILPRFEERDPIVIVSLLVEADLDRAALDFFQWPKPHLDVDEKGALVPGPAVPPSAEAWIEEHGLGVTSYAWAWLSGALGLRSSEDGPGHRERVRRLTPALLKAIRDECEGRGLDYAIVVFQGQKVLRDPSFVPRWQPLLLGELERLGMPYELTAGDLLESGGSLEELFVSRGPARRHYTAAGNRAVFPALRRAIERCAGE